MASDSDLLRPLAGGDSSGALAELLRRHGPMVERTALRYVKDEHLAQDVCQAVFGGLLRKAGSLSKSVTVTGWLYRTAVLMARNAVKTASRRRRHEEAAALERARAGERRNMGLPEGFDDALAGLPETFRQPIVLRFLEGRSRA